MFPAEKELISPFIRKRKKRERAGSKQGLFSKIRFFSLFTALLLSLFLFGFGAGHALELTLLWDKNTESDIEGYRVYSGFSSRNYASAPICRVDRNWNSCTFTVPLDGKTRYYAVTAYNAEGLESNFSNEVHYKSPTGGAGDPLPFKRY